MLQYVFQSIVFQLVFLIAYDLFLKRDTFFNYNRIYLLATSILSLAIPFLKIESFNQVLNSNYIISLPEVVLGGINQSLINNQPITNNVNTIQHSVFTITNVYILTMLIVLTVFLIKLFKVVKLINQNPKTRHQNLTIVHLKETTSAFSFFNFIFLGDTLTNTQTQAIIEHEKVHAKQKHTLDLLWFEALKIVFWFNPLIYLYQNRISNLHEFLADRNAVKINKSEYYQQLLQQVFCVKTYTFINPFFKQSLIKKRIIMLQKSKSKQVNLAKYLLLIPMVFGMLVYSSCSEEETIKRVNIEETFLTEGQLVQKYVEEFKTKYEEPIYSVFKNRGFQNNNYLQTLKEYAQFKALFILIQEDVKWKGKVPINGLEDQSYEEYLEKKKTQEYKDNWENSPKHGTLRSLVENLDIITLEEQKLIDSKIAQIESDDWYHTVLISDGYRHKEIKIREPKDDLFSAKANTTEVPFSMVDRSPLFETCKSITSLSEQKKCFSDEITNHVIKNFNT